MLARTFWLIGSLLTVALLTVESAHAAPKQQLASGDVLVSEAGVRWHDVSVLVERLHRVLREQAGSSVPHELDAIPDVVVRHLAAAELLRAISSDASVKRDAMDLIGWARQQPIRLWVQHEETAAPWYRPWVDLPSLAEDVVELWRIDAQRTAWTDAWRRQSAKTLDEVRVAPPSEQQLAAQGLRSLEDAERRPVIQAALQSPRGLVGVWWSELVQITADSSTVSQLWRSGNAIDRIDAIEAARDRLDWASARELLGEFEQEPELASAATLALLDRAWREPQAVAERQDLLRERLEDPKRALSAASALARFDPPTRTATIRTLLAERPKRAVVPHAYHALRLTLQAAGTPVDHALLDEFFGEESPP